GRFQRRTGRSRAVAAKPDRGRQRRARRRGAGDERSDRMIARRLAEAEDYVLITGGCGFVGTNLAHRLLENGQRVCVFDNLSREGVSRNLEWLRATHGDALKVVI